jgi:sulfur carrier protein
MTIELNGERFEIPSGASIRDAVAAAGADPDQRGIAVAVDGEVVPKRDWPARRLSEGSRIELVQAVQGG